MCRWNQLIYSRTPNAHCGNAATRQTVTAISIMKLSERLEIHRFGIEPGGGGQLADAPNLALPILRSPGLSLCPGSLFRMWLTVFLIMPPRLSPSFLGNVG